MIYIYRGNNKLSNPEGNAYGNINTKGNMNNNNNNSLRSKSMEKKDQKPISGNDIVRKALKEYYAKKDNSYK